MPSLRLRRFGNPSFIQNLSPSIQLRLFEEYFPWFKSKGVEWRADGQVDLLLLAQVLMNLDETAPDRLMDMLFFLDEMSVPESRDELFETARELEIDLDGSDPTDPDLAALIWMKDRDALQFLHAERFLVRPKKFDSFLSTADKLPKVEPIDDTTRIAMESALDEFFDTRKKGRGTRVFPFPRPEGIWFLIRHGQRVRREDAIESGKSSSVIYRPGKFDVLIYNAEIGELAIHADTKGEKTVYCEVLGRHIFGSSTFFDVDLLEGKFTLQPLIDLQALSLVVDGIEGMESVSLAELHWRYNGARYHVEIHKSDDVLAALADIKRRIPRSATLIKAVFKVKFFGAARPRTVALRPPNVAIYDRESDAAVVETWMRSAGFIRRRNEGLRASA